MDAWSKDRQALDTPAVRAGDAAPAAPRDADERLLLERVAAGDKRAFHDLYVLYHLRLARFLTRLTRRYDVAEEIINDTLWVVWRKAPEFRGGSKVSTWIMGIAYRRALKTLRRLNPGAVFLSLDEETTPAVEQDAGVAEDTTGDLHQWLDRALDQLPAEQRLAIELTYYQGLSCAEVAVIAECPVNTVKTRMFHARRKLRMLLPQLDGSHGGPHA